MKKCSSCLKQFSPNKDFHKLCRQCATDKFGVKKRIPHGSVWCPGTGEMHYAYGTLDYVDDGNGNVWEDYYEWEMGIDL